MGHEDQNGLLPLVQISFLCRLNIVSVQVFLLAIIIDSSWHLWAAVRKTAGKTAYPVRHEPAAMIGIVSFFAFLQMTFLLRPPLRWRPHSAKRQQKLQKTVIE